MQREEPLPADAVAHLAHREGGGDAGALAPDHEAFVHLHALLVAFLDAGVDSNGVTDVELGERLAAQVGFFDRLEKGVHDIQSLHADAGGAGPQPRAQEASGDLLLSRPSLAAVVCGLM